MSQGIRHAPLITFFTPARFPIKEGTQPILQLYRIHEQNVHVILYNLTVLLVSIFQRFHAYYTQSGEYRGRTDDLLHAMQAL